MRRCFQVMECDDAALIDAQRDERGLAPGEIMPGIADPFRKAE